MVGPSDAAADEGPFAVGSRIRVSFGRGPLHATIDLEFRALEADRRVAFATVYKARSSGRRVPPQADRAPESASASRGISSSAAGGGS